MIGFPVLAALEERLAELAGEPIAVEPANAHSGGMSHANLIGSGDGGPRLVVRIPPASGPLEPYDVAAESRWLHRARAAGVPAPEVLDVDGTGERFGTPALVARFVAGEILVPLDIAPARGEAIGRELVCRLVQIQAVGLGRERAAGETCASNLLRRWGAVYEAERRRRPILIGELVRRWLAARIPSTPHPVLVHGDYRLGNLIWAGDQVVAVLDWEDARPGDPHYDLAWLLMGTRAPDDLVMNAWPRHKVIAEYSELSGRALEPELLRWWEVAVAWVRMAMEIKLLRLSAAASPPDLRGLIWEFGHGSAARGMLRRVTDGRVTDGRGGDGRGAVR